MMSGGLVSMVILLLGVRLTRGEDQQVTCVLSKECVLPCSFQSGSDEVIHWFKLVDIHVHFYYQSTDQLEQQDHQYRHRTSLFNDQIHRGNASLLLRNVTFQDQGKYHCSTSTVEGNQVSFITVTVEDLQVTCVNSEECVLPCSFQPGGDEVIQWVKLVNIHVHSYYLSTDQLQQQNNQYRHRTSLFNNQIHRGNASLLLRNVRVQDQGRYQCFTRTVEGNQESFVTVTVTEVTVEASTQLVDMDSSEDVITRSYTDTRTHRGITPAVLIAVLLVAVSAGVCIYRRRQNRSAETPADEEDRIHQQKHL